MAAHDHNNMGDEEAGDVPFADELSFLTVDYLSNLMMVENERLVLDFSGFLVKSPSHQQSPVELFRYIHQQKDSDLAAAFYERMVACILMHPLATKIQHLNLSNVACGDDFVLEFVSQMKQYPTLLPNVEIFNVSSNKLTNRGMMAIADLLDSGEDCWPNLQELYVNNNNGNRPYHVTVEQAWAKTLETDRSRNQNLIKFDLDCRHAKYREKIHQRLFQNLDTTKRQLRLLEKQQQSRPEEEEETIEFFTDEPTTTTTAIQKEDDVEMGGGTAPVAVSGNKDDMDQPLLVLDNNNNQSSSSTATTSTRSTLLLRFSSSLSSCFLGCFSCFCKRSRNLLPLSWVTRRGYPNHEAFEEQLQQSLLEPPASDEA